MLKNLQVVDHWHTLIEGFSTSSLDFYDLVKAGVARREIPDLRISQVEWKESGLGSGKRVYLRISRENLNFDICAAPFGSGYFFSWWLAKIPRVLLDLAFLLLSLMAFGIFFAIALTIITKGGENGNPGCAGCAVIFLLPFLFFGALFGLGLLVRFGDTGLEPTVLSMPITGFLYQLLFRPVTYFNEDTAIMFRESVHQAATEAIDQVTTAQGVRGLSEEARKITFEPRGRRN
jgi:hypothetical protein